MLDLFLLVVALARARGVAPAPAIAGALARAADALATLVQGSEPQPAFGDADDGRAFVLDGAENRDVNGVAATIAACLDRRSETADPAALLLFGGAGAAAPPAPARDAVLADSGLAVLRRARTRTLFDAGPLGYLSLAAHGHADALQVTLADEGLELVTDPGTGSYYGDRARRAAFRSTAFHPTVTVDGLDQAEQAGPFLWRDHYTAALRVSDLDRGVLVGEHDGYARLPDPVSHRRAVLALDDGSLLVYDRLGADGHHAYVQTWPLHPTLEASAHGATVEARLESELRLLIAVAASSPGRLRLRRGEHEPLAGWWSRRLEAAEPAWTVQHEVACTGGVGLAALLLVARGGGAPDPELALRDEAGSAHIEFTHDGRRHHVEVDVDDRARPVRVETTARDEEALR